MGNERSKPTDRELIFSRLLDAPIKLVWEVWTKPEVIKLWWGPADFKNTIKTMDVRPGGRWDLTMHSPAGIDYDIKAIFKEIVKHKKIVYEHLSPFRYIATIEFESIGNKTQLNWVMVFESKEYLIETAKIFGVDIGLQQNGQRLVDYLQGSIVK